MIPTLLRDHLPAPDRQVVPIDPGPPGRVRIGDELLINMTSGDYLGLGRHHRVVAAAGDALRRWGLGTGATRTLSGGTTVHRALEDRLARLVGCDDAVLHGSCWAANAAVFEILAGLARRAGTTLAVFSDRLDHASIVDAVRAQRSAVSVLETFDRHDLSGLPAAVAGHPGTLRVVVTDGVFSMEGDQANLRELTRIATAHDALLVVDDSHGVGVTGPTGRGTAEARGVLGEVDVITGTLGKALGGAAGGFVATTAGLAGALRAGSRPFVFSNNPPTPVVAGVLAGLDVLESDADLLAGLRRKVGRLREGVEALGLPSVPGEHPIVPVVVGADDDAHALSAALRRHGVYATALTFPVVPRGEARVRLQVSALHSEEDLDQVLAALARPVPAGAVPAPPASPGRAGR